MNALERGLAPPLEAVLKLHFLKARENLDFATIQTSFRHINSLAEGSRPEKM